MHAICRTGDRVLVASPGWPGHHGAIAAVGGTSVHVPAAAEDNFLLDPRALERAWQPGTRALILASPANPTGSVYDADRLVAIAEWAEKREVWIISDDIYRSFAYDREHVPLLAVAPGARARTIVVDGVSKAHAMTGWRVGWLAAPQNVVGAADHPHSAKPSPTSHNSPKPPRTSPSPTRDLWPQRRPSIATAVTDFTRR